MNLLETLKECEPNIAQMSRDLGVSRRAIYDWGNGFVRRDLFDRISKVEKYKDALSRVDYDSLRKQRPFGPKHKSW